MTDNLHLTGKPDRERLNHNEPYEMKDLAAKFSITPQEAKSYTEKYGPMRSDVESAIREKKAA